MAAADRARDVPVVVARAGPAGLVAAVTLARHGVGSLLVERNPALEGPAPDGSEALTEDLNGRLPHAWVPGGNGHRRSTLDLLGPGLTLLTGPAAPAWAGDHATPFPLEVHTLDSGTADVPWSAEPAGSRR